MRSLGKFKRSPKRSLGKSKRSPKRSVRVTWGVHAISAKRSPKCYAITSGDIRLNTLWLRTMVSIRVPFFWEGYFFFRRKKKFRGAKKKVYVFKFQIVWIIFKNPQYWRALFGSKLSSFRFDRLQFIQILNPACYQALVQKNQFESNWSLICLHVSAFAPLWRVVCLL